MSPFCGLAFACSCFVLFRVAAGAEPCAALGAARLGRSAGRNPKQRRAPQVCRHSRLRAADLLPRKLAPSIFDLDRSVLPLAHHYLPLRRCVLSALRLHLKQTIVVSHHPVVTDDPLGLQPEHFPQFCLTRCPPVIVLRLRCRTPESPVVLRQIFLLQIMVRPIVRPYLFPPHLLDQPVLMRAVVALHSPLGLRRPCRNDLDPQLLAHPPELRDRFFASQLFALCGRAFIHVLPIHVQRLRHSVFFDPAPQRVCRCPDRLLFAQPQLYLAGRIVGHVHRAAVRTAPLQPVVKTSVHLHSLTKVSPSLSPLPIRLPLASPPPQPFRQHPPPQRLRIDPHPVFARQMFGRQRRPKSPSLASPVLLLHQLHHPPAKPRRLGSRARSSRTAMLQPFGPFFLIPLPQPLRLPVTYPREAGAIHHLQLSAFHSRQHFHPTQFPQAHLDSPHPASFRGRSLGDISIEEKRGHYHRGSTSRLMESPIDKIYPRYSKFLEFENAPADKDRS